jgi:release factor glutamine methyltransferase
VTRAEALRKAANRLQAAGIEDARGEARHLLASAGELSQARMITALNERQPADEAARFEALIERRAAREPLSHILGNVGFWTLELEVTPDVLTPRPDTESVVEAALEAVEDRTAPLRVLDIGTGSGAILLALLSDLPGASGVATDISPAALAVARRNAQRNGLAERITFVETCWADGLEGPFDLVVSNPPYIASAVIETLEPEVKDHEPRLALDGGPDGLGPYPHLLSEARRLLRPGGTAVFEIGYDQGQAVLALACDAGAWNAGLRQDLAGRDRALIAGFA